MNALKEKTINKTHNSELPNALKTPYKYSAIYAGDVRHRRYAVKRNFFSYRLYMLALDIDEIIEYSLPASKILGFSWFNPVRFVPNDYLRDKTITSNNVTKGDVKGKKITNDLQALKKRIKSKVLSLYAESSETNKEQPDIQRITMLSQARCFGVYFSPANFFFCYNTLGRCTHMLAEVSNTPWNKRHYYLVNLQHVEPVTDKSFHVSPFMDMNMQYHWKVQPVDAEKSNVLVHIENRTGEQAQQKLFDATLQMKKQSFTVSNLFKVWLSLPVMTLKIFAGIYWQALKLFLKRVPFISYIENK